MIVLFEQPVFDFDGLKLALIGLVPDGGGGLATFEVFERGRGGSGDDVGG